MDLTQFQWKNRMLFLFAPDGNNPDFKKYKAIPRSKRLNWSTSNLALRKLEHLNNLECVKLGFWKNERKLK
jgi:hypothetical protein